MQTKVTKRFSDGTSAGAAWTWSKTMNFADNEDLGSLSFPYPAFWGKNYAPSGFDRPQNIEVWAVAQLPFGKGEPWLQNGAGSWILGGWQINPVISRLSGVPFTVGAGGNLNANGSGQTADLVGKFRKLNGKPPRTGVTCAQSDLSCHYFDPSAFAAPLITSDPATAHYGNTNRNAFRGPSFFNMNLTVLRDFKVKERLTLEVRADAFGFTNTPHFANPNVSCPGSATTSGSVGTSGQLCSTGSSTGNFGIVTGTAQPGGFFGPDAGNRVIWLGANVKF